MRELSTKDGHATLIGDIVGSRRASNRRGLQSNLEDVLSVANQRLRPVGPLEPTVGDEFQGRFESIASAAKASLVIRLDLFRRTGVDSRYGLGFGEVSVVSSHNDRGPQDGPGWWAARNAIDRARDMSIVRSSSFVRTCFSQWLGATGGPGKEGAFVEAFLLTRDAAVSRMSERGRRLLLGIMLGIHQEDLADLEGISQGAVSQSLKRSGAIAIKLAHERLDYEVL